VRPEKLRQRLVLVISTDISSLPQTVFHCNICGNGDDAYVNSVSSTTNYGSDITNIASKCNNCAYAPVIILNLISFLMLEKTIILQQHFDFGQ